MSLVIGIDLGTTNSCTSIYTDGRVKILENKDGGRITPSVLFFMNTGGVVIGQHAKRLTESRPEYGVYEIKRLIGRKYDDPVICANLNHFKYDIKNNNNEPIILIRNQNVILKKNSIELSAMILQKLRADVESKLMTTVNNAVITVPAYFSMSQREATLAAATKAGFTVVKLLNEPTAAAMAYYFEKPNKGVHHSLVYDLGGGTFDVAILKSEGNQFNIISVDGDTHLGGHDFDKLLLDFVIGVLEKDYKYNPKNDRRVMRRLINECEEAKKLLSTTDETIITLSCVLESCIEISMTREKFEIICQELFDRTISVVDRCLSNSYLTVNQIDEVILSGGSTRIPKVQKMISAYFKGKKLNCVLNPDECVAEGAALQAAMLSTHPSQKINVMNIVDVTPLSLGISGFVDVMTFLIPRNTKIPVTKSTTRVTIEDKQDGFKVEIYEGERVNSKKNRLLGILEITNITPAPPGQCSITVTMTIDNNGILSIFATETLSNKTKNLKIEYTKGLRNHMDIESIIKDAATNKREDEEFEKFADAKAYVYKYCVRALYNFKEKNLINAHQVEYFQCEKALKEVKTLKVSDEDKLQQLKKNLENKCGNLVIRYDFKNMP